MNINDRDINFLSVETEVQGKIFFDQTARIHGVVRGELHGRPGSTLILMETALVEGKIFADQLIVDGFVQGDIVARGRVTITRLGRVVGKIHSPRLHLEPGSYFDGSCSMEGETLLVSSSLQPALT
mgnify:CR=1 FL=1